MSIKKKKVKEMKILKPKFGIIFSLFLIIMVFSPFMSLMMVRGEDALIKSPQTSETISWTLNGTAVSTFAQNQNEPRMIADGAGGAIITWRDWRSASNYDIYAQRIDSNGNNATGWPGNGTAICIEGSEQRYPELISDGAGGAIIVWQDWRGAQDIYTQRINSTGGVEWAANGIAVCNAAQSQSKPKLVSDGAGGAIIVWNDWRSASTYDIYAQRIDSDGIVVAGWTVNGVLITNATNDQEGPQIVSDGSGGAIISWQDRRDQGTTEYDIYARKINSAGAVQWDANGTLICNAVNWQSNAKLVSDGAGGAIIAWQDERSGDSNVFAQRINSGGTTLWTANGTIICNAINNQGGPRMISDGIGGAILTWSDNRDSNWDIYVLRIDSNGNAKAGWTINGTAICTADQDQGNPEIVSDGAGGAIITYENDTGTEADVYAQKINAAGAVQWTTNGTPVSTATNDQMEPHIASDGDGGAIIAWDDGRGISPNDIYAQRIADPPPEDETPSNGEEPPGEETPPGIPGFDLMILSIISTISVIILLQKNRKKQL